MAIFTTACSQNGHKIDSVQANDKLIPLPNSSKDPIVICQFVILCTACGMTLDEIREKEKEPPKRLRKRKPTNVTTSMETA